MNHQIDTFIGILISKLMHLDHRLSYDMTPIKPEYDYNKVFHGGIELTIKLEVLVINVATVKWLINLLDDFNFNYDLSISRYLLDPKRNAIDEVPKDFQFHSNNEFYLSINPSKTKLKGRFVGRWNSNGDGWHISNASWYFKSYYQREAKLQLQPQSILPAQMN